MAQIAEQGQAEIQWSDQDHQMHFIELVEDAYSQLLLNSEPKHDHVKHTETVNALHSFLKRVGSEVAG